MTGTGWADLDQLLGYSGNVDFPYFPGETSNLPPLAPNIDNGSTQWNDLFSNLTNANGWGTVDGGYADMNVQPSQPLDWMATLQQGNGNGNGQAGNGSDQTQGDHKVNEYFQHLPSSLGN